MTQTFNIPIHEEIKDVLWESITSSLGIDFRFEDQSGSRDPATGIPEGKNYGTIKLITGPVQVGDSDFEGFSDDGNGNLLVTTSGQRELTASINIYRAGSGSLMSKLQRLFNSRVFRHKLFMLMKNKYKKELVIVEALASQDLTSLVQSDYEERFQMDVRLRTVSKITEALDPIEEVTIDGKVVNEADEVVDEGKTTINIP